MTAGAHQRRTLDVLIACHNRRELTLRCLDLLVPALDSLDATDSRIILVDDGSTDGTASSVRAHHPQVTIVPGDGSLYWAGGMRRGFVHAAAERSADGFLLVNDDVELDASEVKAIVDHWHTMSPQPILVGQTTSPDGSSVTYSGFKQTSKWRLLGLERVSSRSDLLEVDTFNANFVLVPGELMRGVGGLDPAYTHGLADIDLGLTAQRLGVPSKLWPAPIGVCERGPDRNSMLQGLPRRERARRLFVHPYGLRPDLHFARKHRPQALLPVYALLGAFRRVVQLIPRAKPSS